MIVDTEAALAARHALRLCADQHHGDCANPAQCERAERALDRQLADVASFDARLSYMMFARREPSANHPTAALMRGVADMAVSPPWSDPLWRSIWITSALARLAERGIPADAVLRTGVGQALRERLAFEAASAWYAMRHGSLDGEEVEPRIRAWAIILDSAIQSHHDDPDALEFVEVVVLARSGVFGEVLRRWIEQTAVAHVIDWRATDPLRVELLPRDLVVGGGREATQWIFDRFTCTYLGDWRPSSLLWELSYSQDPDGVADRTQVPAAVLAERSVSSADLLRAVTGRHATARPVTASSHSLAEELYDQIILLARGGDLQRAREMASIAAQENPEAAHFRNAYAFLTIPVDPNTARQLLNDAELRSLQPNLYKLNWVVISIASGDVPDAVGRLEEAKREIDGAESAWLWVPERLIVGEWILEYYTFDQWCSEATQALTSASA